jgi:hypothetical protein
MGVQKHNKKRLQKNRAEKLLQKNRLKNHKPIFFSIFLITFLGFSRWGEFKNTDQPWYFFGLRGTNQPRATQTPSGRGQAHRRPPQCGASAAPRACTGQGKAVLMPKKIKKC